MKSDWLPSLWREREGDPFQALRKQMDDLFNDWSSGLPGWGRKNGNLALRVDVSETPTEITVTADLPGVDQKDIDVTAAGNQLTIKAEKKSEAEDKKEDKGRTFHTVERSYGLFQRTMSLPFEIDSSKVSASFQNGVLTLTLPKPVEMQKQTKKIEVKGTA